MALWNFVQKRMQMLGLTFRQIEDEFEIAYATMQRIRQNKPIKDSTKQKLALALSCSMGDINAAIANSDGPEPEDKNNKESEAPVMEAVNKLEQMVETEYPEVMEQYPKKVKVKTESKSVKSESKPEADALEVMKEQPEPEQSPLVLSSIQNSLSYNIRTSLPGECDIYINISTFLPRARMLRILDGAVELIKQELNDARQGG